MRMCYVKGEAAFLLPLTSYLIASSKEKTCEINFKTRGPKGPWVAHLRKRSKVTVEPFIENPRGII